ncbi:GMC oxidoreductase protein [Rutstroemia sp. NJR-2017a BBW]|nr:GMC oxidoreductase protein [Rutstroemia sp. NJR-2017a BBW]
MVDLVAPIVAPLPDPPEGQYFTDLQWATLMAIMDTVVPSIHRASIASDPATQFSVPDEKYNDAVSRMRNTITSPPDDEALGAYLNEKPSDIPAFQDLLLRTLTVYAREDARKVLGVILSTLNTRLGSLMLTGYAAPIQSHSINIRESILDSWRNSYLFPLRAIAKTMSLLGKHLWLKTSPNFDRVTGFTKVPHHYKPGPHFEYEFLQFPARDEPQIVEADVVIVGSGCGGAVCAKNLAEQGHKVIVVEKSYYYPPSQLPMSEAAAGVHLFENGGIIVSDDSSTSVVAGSNWGGGGTVNWSASLQTQDYVRKEWAEDRGLQFFGTAEFQESLDRVCQRMGVSAEHIRHNHGNQMLMEGSRKLGYHAKAVPQNTGGHEHYCGHCSVGCGSAQKQGPVVSWLPDSAKAGAEFIEGFKIDRVMFDDSNGAKKAVGVKGIWTSRNINGGVDGHISQRTVREVIVRAKKVIISCGTLWTPVILKNSGLTNPQIGRNLYLHPVNMVGAVYIEDVKPWEGGILTSVCSSFENLDSHGHGVKLETTCMLPSLSLPTLNYPSGFDYKLEALKFRHMNVFISIARDRDTGLVYPDAKTGLPRIAYTPSEFDRGHIKQGILALAKICYVTGAREIHVTALGMEPFVRDPATLSSSPDPSQDPSFQAWLTRLANTSTKPPASQFVSAHQMGTSRMSKRPEDGVVDPKGRVWGTEGLYVSDASVFPSASGVNPMVTNMAISDWISRGVARELKGEKEGERARL